MEAIIRADASLTMGTGHVMRCLTLAEDLREHGIVCHFVCQERPGHLRDLVLERGFECRLIPYNDDGDPYALGGSLTHEQEVIGSIAETCRIRSGKKPILILDHYGIDITLESSLRPSVDRILVIDDLEDRQHDCDILLNQNFSLKPERYRGLVPDHCQLLLGPEYALLRKEFRQMRELIRASGRPRFDVRKVLVFFGGSDFENFTGRALQQLAETGEFEPEVVVGKNHPCILDIQNQMQHFAGGRLHVQTDRMAEIMARCSWYLGAGGSVTWERMALGLTGIVIPVAKNQKAICRDMAEAGLQLSLEDVSSLPLDRLVRLCNRNREYEIDSGKNPSIAPLLLGAVARTVDLRPVAYNDCYLLFNWANDPVVRAASFNSGPIQYKEHVKWFELQLLSDENRFFLLEVNAMPAGQIRFALSEDGIWLINYSIASTFRGKGLSSRLIDDGINHLVHAHSAEPIRIGAYVKKGNSASIKAFDRSVLSFCGANGDSFYYSNSTVS